MSIVSLRELKQPSYGFWYLATPYSKFPHGIHQAYLQSCKTLSWFINNEISVFCPIAHTHHVISVDTELPIKDTDFWMRFNRPFMAAAKGLIIATLPSWAESIGIEAERRYFEDRGRNILFYNPENHALSREFC